MNNIENAILLWQEFSKNEDFAQYNADKAIDFKKWLAKRDVRGKLISIVTSHVYLRYLRKFFGWLVRETGYKSRIKPNAVDYLKITEKEGRIATQSTPRTTPRWNTLGGLLSRSTFAPKLIDATERWYLLLS